MGRASYMAMGRRNRENAILVREVGDVCDNGGFTYVCEQFRLPICFALPPDRWWDENPRISEY